MRVKFFGRKSWGNYAGLWHKNFLLRAWGAIEVEDKFEIAVIKETNESLSEYFLRSPGSELRVFFGAEGIWPDLNLFDYFLNIGKIGHPNSFQLHPYFVFADFFDPKEPALEIKIEDWIGREFCDFLYSNANAHPIRDSFFKELSRIRNVSSYGRHLNNSGWDSIRTSWSENWPAKKRQLHAAHKFSIAIENSNFPGYVTEKLFLPALSGAIPIYWGGDSDLYINPARIIRIKDENDICAVAEYVSELDDDTAFKIASEPIFLKNQIDAFDQNMSDLLNFLEKIAGDRKRNRPIGTAQAVHESWIKGSLFFNRRFGSAVLRKIYPPSVTN